MCGRFVSATAPERIAEYFGATSTVETLGENFNVAPTNDIYGVVDEGGDAPELQVFHWGLIPVWAKERKIGQRMINARSETLAEKAAFKADFRNNRIQRQVIRPTFRFPHRHYEQIGDHERSFSSEHPE